MAVAWSKRAALRAGYGAVVAVLVLSAVEAYSIQVGVSQQHLEIYRRFVQQDEALSTLRRNLWLAGNRVRDFFINPTELSGDDLSIHLRVLKEEDEAVFQVLERSPRHRAVVP